MNNVVAHAKCDTCGGVFVPPAVASHVTVWPAMDYVCIKCGREYRWVETPPKLKHPDDFRD